MCQRTENHSFPAANAASRRGAAMIFVMVVLVLIVMLGLMYMQTARTDRFATRNMARQNIDQIANAAVGQISGLLASDLWGSDNLALNCDAASSSVGTWSDLGFHAIFYPRSDSAFNYPWTNTVVPGYADNRWLGSTTPDSTGVWRHITDLRPVLPENTGGDNYKMRISGFLRGVGTQANPVEDPTLLSNSVSVNDNDLADADVDGIKDSRWVWAPIPQWRDRAYVMAVRIVDLSSRVNVNAALAQSTAGGGFVGGNMFSRSRYPTDLNLGLLFNDDAKLSGLTTYRMGAGAPVAQPNRDLAWENGVAKMGGATPGYKFFTVADEIELLYRGGLDNPDVNSPLEQYLPPPTFSGPNDYFQKNPRVMLTTFSGTSRLAPRLPDLAAAITHVGKDKTTDITNPINDSYYPTRVDLNALLAQHVKNAGNGNAQIRQQATEDLSWQIRRIWERRSNPADISDIPLFIRATHPKAGAATPEQLREAYAMSLAAAIMDYAASDVNIPPNGTRNRLTEVKNPTAGLAEISRVGMKALPFITEVYFQHPHLFNAVAGAAPNWTVRLTPPAGAKVGFIIEIGNPFNRDITFADVHLYIRGRHVPQIATEDLAAMIKRIDATGAVPQKAGVPYLPPGKVLILYRNSNSNGQGTHDDMLALLPPVGDAKRDNMYVLDLKTEADGTEALNLGSVAYPNSPAEIVNVDLRTCNTAGTIYTWPYCRYNTYRLPTTWTNFPITSATAPTVGNICYVQYSTKGTANGVNMLTVPALTGVGLDPAPPAPTLPAAIDHTGWVADHDKFGEKIKGTPFDARLDPVKTQIVLPNREYISSIGELAQVCMLAPVPPQGANPALTVGDVFTLGVGNVAGPVANFHESGFYLNFKSTVHVDNAGPDYQRVPHATFLLSRLAAYTNTNNTNKAADLPGLINLNTVSLEVLEKTLPIPNAALRASVAAAIIAYRDQLPPFDGANRNLGAGTRTAIGIAHVGELYAALESLAPTVDDYGQPVTDERARRALILRWLSAYGTTRSDFFVGYVLIRGYEVGKFNKSPVEEKRFFAVFDRSGMRNPTDSVAIRAMCEY